MAWIESHQSLGRHPKTRKAARLLSVSRPAVVGHLQYLWWWCLDFAQDGDLGQYDDDEIAEAAEWDEDPATFIAALTEAGFITADRLVHDWDDYAGKLIEQRKANAEKQKRWRDRNKPDTSPTHNDPVTVTSPLRNGATVPNRTVPNQTEPNPTVKTPPPAKPEPPPEPVAPPSGGESVRDIAVLPVVHGTRFAAFWDAYPKKVGKKACSSWWGKRRPDADLTQTILDAVAAHKDGDQWQRGYIKDPIRWLQEERWNDDVASVPSPANAPVQAIPTNGRAPGRSQGMISADTLNWAKRRQEAR